MFYRFVSALGLLALSFNAFATDYQCPKTISTSQSLSKQAAGWTEFVRPDGKGKVSQISHVEGIALYSGDPNELAQLKPDDEDAHLNSWSFDEPAKPEQALYMTCRYWETRVQFSKKLPLNVKKCTAIKDGVLRCEEFKR